MVTKAVTVRRHAPPFAGTLIKKAKPPSSFPGDAAARKGARPYKPDSWILHKRLMETG